PPSSLSHIRPPPTSSLFPCTTLFRSPHRRRYRQGGGCSSVVSDSRTCHETLRRFLKARIPFISIRTAERDRALDILRSIAQELTTSPMYEHTLSRGLRDIVSGRVVSEERTIHGVLDIISQQVVQRQNLTYVLTDVDIEDEGELASQLRDLVSVAVESGGAIVVISPKPVWSRLQRMGMSVVLDPPNEDEMYEIIQAQ